MDLVSYLNRKVHLTLRNGFYYIGVVTNADEDSLTLIDKNNRSVSVSKFSVETIREVAA